CNVRGLTPLGEHAVRSLMDRGMLINIDHMGVKTATRTLDIAEEVGYSGLVVDHNWAASDLTRRMHELGGFVASFAYPADRSENFEESFLDVWRENTRDAGRPFAGYGFGSDVNGLAPLAEPRPTAAADPLPYPFPAPNGAGAPADERRRGVDGGVGTRAVTGAADRVGRLWVLALTLGVVAVFASWFGPLQILLPAQTDRIAGPGGREALLGLVVGVGAA